MRLPLRLKPGRHAAADPAATEPAAGGRAFRGAARGALIFALVAGTGAVAVAQAGFTRDGEASPEVSPTAIAASVRSAIPGLLEAASRSDVRLAPAFVELTVDGETVRAFTAAETIGDFLAERGVELGVMDRVSAALDADPADTSSVTVTRVTFTDVTDSTELAFSTREVKDSSLAKGKTVVDSEGRAGSETVISRVILVDGVEESREVLIKTVVPAQDRVVRVGTYVPPTSSAPSGSYSGQDPRSIARSMVAARGWSSAQFDCLDRLWQKESNWNPYAQNPSSGAYGIPQALPGSKMGTVASDWRTNPVTQITWGLNYIAARYGTPCAAWSHSQAVNWY